MSKNRLISSISEFIVAFIIIGSYIGYCDAIALFKVIFAQINLVLTSMLDTSLINEVFNHMITYQIVGVILVFIAAPRNKTGKFIGKVLYFLVGNVVGIALNFMSMLVFK